VPWLKERRSVCPAPRRAKDEEVRQSKKVQCPGKGGGSYSCCSPLAIKGDLLAGVPCLCCNNRYLGVPHNMVGRPRPKSGSLFLDNNEHFWLLLRNSTPTFFRAQGIIDKNFITRACL